MSTIFHRPTELLTFVRLSAGEYLVTDGEKYALVQSIGHDVPSPDCWTDRSTFEHPSAEVALRELDTAHAGYYANGEVAA